LVLFLTEERKLEIGFFSWNTKVWQNLFIFSYPLRNSICFCNKSVNLVSFPSILNVFFSRIKPISPSLIIHKEALYFFTFIVEILESRNSNFFFHSPHRANIRRKDKLSEIERLGTPQEINRSTTFGHDWMHSHQLMNLNETFYANLDLQISSFYLREDC